MEDAGLVNVYTCQICGGRIVTKNRDAGTTPFFLRCRATTGCDGDMYSGFYRVDQQQPHGWEWFKPLSAGERKKLDTVSMVEHVAMGGLILRQVL